MSDPARPPPVLLRLLAAGVVLALCADPVLTGMVLAPVEVGLSTFGRPPELAALWAVAGLALAVLMLRASSRSALARRLTLTLLAGCLYGQRTLPAQPGALLVLAGLALLVARPRLRLTASGWVGLAALLGALPASLASPFPLGVVLWLCAAIPWCALAVLLPSLLAGARARRAALVFVGVTALFAAVSLATYLQLAHGLQLPLSALLSTRLRPLGLHPNLGVPQLVTALVVGCSLAWDPAEPRRRLVQLGLLPIVAALAAVQSRTGHLTAALGLAVLVLGRLPWAPARLLRPALALALLAALLVPVTGASDASITRRSANMVSKAVSFRSAMWELGRDTAAAAPWTGFGPGRSHVQAQFARPSRYDGLPKNDHPHNVVLSVVSLLGWPGLCVLAALLWLSLRRPFGDCLLADGTTAALAGMWAANALDMGGASQTHYPALAFLLLGLGDAAVRARTLGSASAARLGAAPAGLAVLVLGLACWAGGLLRQEAERALDETLTPINESPNESSIDSPSALRIESLLERAALVNPWDLRVPLARARLEERRGRLGPQVERVEAALALQPDSAALVHTLALLLARSGPDDARVGELLDRALVLDAWGEDAWRRHVDRALLAAHRGDEAGALDSFVTALLMAPAAVQRAGWDGESDRLSLTIDGSRGLSLPLDQVLAEVGRRREDLGRQDAPSLVRLRMREVEILQALGEHERAAERTRRVLADEDFYLLVQLGRTALAQGRYDEAAAYLEQAWSVYQAFRIFTDLLEARAHAEPLDVAAFEALVEQALTVVPDVLFEPDAIAQLLRARQHVAERSLDAAAASRWARAAEFAAR